MHYRHFNIDQLIAGFKPRDGQVSEAGEGEARFIRLVSAAADIYIGISHARGRSSVFVRVAVEEHGSVCPGDHFPVPVEPFAEADPYFLTGIRVSESDTVPSGAVFAEIEQGLSSVFRFAAGQDTAFNDDRRIASQREFRIAVRNRDAVVPARVG